MNRIQITATASGSAGSATATAHSTHVRGLIHKVHVAYSGSPPATTDVILQDENDPASENIVTLPDNAVDATLYPRRKTQDNANNNITYDGSNEIYDRYPIHGRLKLSVSQANDGDSVTVTAWINDTH